MIRYESLVAKEYVVRELLAGGNTIEDNVVNKMSNTELAYILRAENTFMQRCRLLDRVVPIDTSNSDEVIRACLMERAAEEWVDNEVLNNGFVCFNWRLNLIRVKIDQDIPWHNRDLLVLNEYLINGYTFTEVIGSHFLVKVNGMLRAVTLNKCGCLDYEKFKCCDHIRCVRALNNNPKQRLHKLTK